MGVAIEPFFDPATSTMSYVVHDPATGRAAIVDPVLDFDPELGSVSGDSVRRLLAHICHQHLVVDWILETHVHADHLSAAGYLRSRIGGRIAIGEGIRAVRSQLGLSAQPPFDRLLRDGEMLALGEKCVTALSVPGHTPADLAFLLDDAVFVGDTLFMPDVGTARADFPGGDAAALFRSIRRVLRLPGQTRLYVCHDYPPRGRGPRCESTVSEQRAHNVHARDAVSQAEFVAMRQARDATLRVPALFELSVEVNACAGMAPRP